MDNNTITSNIYNIITLIKSYSDIDLVYFFKFPNLTISTILFITNILVSGLITYLILKFPINITNKYNKTVVNLLKSSLFGIVVIVIALLQMILIKEKYEISCDFCVKLMHLGICFVIYKISIFVISIGIYKHRYGNFIYNISRTLLAITFICISTGTANDVDGILRNITIPLMGKSYISIWDILAGMLSILVTTILSLWVIRFIDSNIEKSNTINESTKQILSRTSRVLCFTISTIIILPALGVNITALSVLGGGVGVGIGIGLQRVASNFIGGFIILLDKSIKVGDKVQLDGQNIGYIRKITMRYAVLEKADGIKSLVPNEYFITNVIQSYNYSDAPLMVENIINISLTQNNIEAVLEVFTTALWTMNNIEKEPQVRIQAIDIANDSVTISLKVWVATNSLTGITKNNMLILIAKTINTSYIK